ncbi:unnamed protein product [Thlaspi arvense]|uniref:MATH domain-containing protein n=1 Tax=Thlaspi arvense TaxID=13288 RepID=A0AAU9RP52_THLAR|nr:unnamed protein product [Thlaspi arvense]
MEDQKLINFKFEIDNLLEKESEISSPIFLRGGCEWFAKVCPKGHDVEDHLSLYICVANTKSLRLGWKRRASCSLVLLNQSGKELYRTVEFCQLFCAQFPAWGFTVSLKMLKEKGYVEKRKLNLKVEVKVVEVVDESEVTRNETNETLMSKVFKVVSVTMLFARHPDIAANFKPKNQLLDNISLETKKGNSDGLRVEKHIRTLALKKEKAKSSTSAAKDYLEGVVRSWKLRLGFADLGGKIEPINVWGCALWHKSLIFTSEHRLEVIRTLCGGNHSTKSGTYGIITTARFLSTRMNQDRLSRDKLAPSSLCHKEYGPVCSHLGLLVKQTV